MKKNKKKVFVGMSGGVDSSVAAALLKDAGFDVTGVFIQGWYPDFLECDWKEDKRDAMRVAALLEIPFITIDAEKAYKEEVVDYMIQEYKNGRTPNPDIMCNRHVKFGVFYKKALEMGADFIATGHYARTEFVDGDFGFKAGVDPEKDQSYFLWNVNKDALEKTLFPLGDYQKNEVREIARERGLFTAEKKDSQGICFLGKVSMKDFISHYVTSEKGDVLDPEGNVIGFHPGALLFTLGERRGFTITKKGTDDNPRFVVEKDIHKNTITVSEKESDLYKNFLKDKVELEQVNWLSREPETDEKLFARYRHRGKLTEVSLEKNEGKWMVNFVEPQESLAPGQSLVVYNDEVCLGGGVVM